MYINVLTASKKVEAGNVVSMGLVLEEVFPVQATDIAYMSNFDVINAIDKQKYVWSREMYTSVERSNDNGYTFLSRTGRYKRGVFESPVEGPYSFIDLLMSRDSDGALCLFSPWGDGVQVISNSDNFKGATIHWYGYIITRDGDLYRYDVTAPVHLFKYPDKWETVDGNYGIKKDGTLWDISSMIPSPFHLDNNWKDIICHQRSVGPYPAYIGVKKDGSGWSWGGNILYATGLGTNSGITSSPTRIDNEYNWTTKVDMFTGPDGYTAFNVVKSDGSLCSWGSNYRGLTGLGIDTESYTTRPALVDSGKNWKYMGYGVGLKTNGTIWATGPNDNYRTGQGVNTGHLKEFTQIGNNDNWRDLVWGGKMASRGDGSVFIWGRFFGSEFYKTPTNIWAGSRWKKIIGHYGIRL